MTSQPSQLDIITRKVTAFRSYDELLVNARTGYVPTLHPGHRFERLLREALIRAEVAVWPKPDQTELEQMSAGWLRAEQARLLARFGY